MAGVIKVLYVDDEPNLLALTKIFLEKSGEFHVDTVTSAQKALTDHLIHTYDAIISDYQMPGMDGIAFLIAVRERYGDIPFILFTGKGREEIVIDAINNGADFYLQKGGQPKAQFVELAHKIRKSVKRKQAEDKIMLLNTSVDQAYDEVFWLDFDGNILYVNEAACRTTGYSREELYDMKIFTLDPDFPPEIWGQSVADLRQRKNQFIITRHRCKNGTIIDVEIMTSYVQKGETEYSFAFVRDISDRKRAEEINARKTEYLSQIFSLVKTGIVIIDSTNQEIIDINPAGAKLIGLPKEQIIGNVCHKFICPDETGRCPIIDLHQPVDNAERILITRDGKKIPIIKYVTLINLDGRECLLETFIENSEHRREEDAVRESEEKFRSVFENSPYPIAINSLPDFKFIEVNKAFLNISGYTEEEILGKDPMELGLLGLKEALKLASHRVLKGKLENIPLTLKAKEERLVHVLFSTLPITINDKPAVITVTAEVTHLKRVEEQLLRKNEDLNAAYEELTAADEELRLNFDLLAQKEQALRENSDIFQAVVEQSNEGIFIVDFTGRILYANRRAYDIVDNGKDLDTTGTISVLDFLSPGSRQNAENMLSEVSLGHDRVLLNFNLITIANREKWVECIGRNISFKGSPSILLSFRDVTERIKSEKELSDSENKFATVFRSNPVSLTLVSATEGIFTDVNDAFLQGTGYTRTEVIGKTAKEVGIFADEKEYIRLVSVLQEKHFVHGMELRCRIKTGEIRTCRFTSNVILIGGRPQILSIVEDITERKLADDAIRESEERYRLILENTNEGILVNELTPRGPGKIIDANESACRILGMSREEMHNLSLVDLDTPEMKKRAPEIIQEIMRTRHIVFQTNYLTKDNREKIIDISVSLFDLNGNPTMLSVVRDITEQKAGESALRAQVSGMVGTTGRESLDRIAESISVWLGADCIMIGEITPDQEHVRVLSMILDGNRIEDYSYTLKGTPCESTAEKGFCIYPDNVARLFPDSRDLSELHIRGYAGTPLRNLEGKIVGILCILMRNPLNLPSSAREIIDIIAAKAAAEIGRLNALKALSESEEKFRALVEHSLDGTLILDPEGKILFANNTAGQIIDVQNLDEIIGTRNVMEFISPSSQNDVRKDFHKVAEGVDGFIARYRILTVNQKERWVESIGKLISFQNTQSILISIRDITDRQRAEEALKESEERFRKIFSSSVLGTSLISPDLRFLLVNPAGVSMLGYTEEEMQAMTYQEITHPDDLPINMDHITDLKTGARQVYSMEKRYIRKDGSILWGSIKVTTIRDHKDELLYYLAQIEDITPRKQAEEALRQANKKLNLLSGITRHDINNQLSILNSCVEMLQRNNSHPSGEDYFSYIQMAINQITNMIRFTQEYEQIGVHNPIWQDLTALVNNAGNYITLGQVSLHVTIKKGTQIYTDPLISKVFYNLIDNAMRHGGSISMIQFSSEARGTDLVITCEDDGEGVAIGNKEKIFYRDFGKNTGFGLYISREILDITGITIKETGEPGKGARFEIVIPEGQYRVIRQET